MQELPYTGDTYCTEEHQPSLPARVFPNLTLYSKLASTVFWGSRKACHGQYDNEQWCQDSWRLLRAMESVGARIEVTGLDYVRQNPKQACVIIANHMSILETLILPGMVQPFRNATFIVKQSLLDYPVFRHIMRSRDPIAVGRTNPRQDLKAVLEGGMSRLEHGISIIVFPQTTRTTVLDPAQFNTIGVKLAQRANVPVIPCALKTDAWQNGRMIKDFGPIDVTKTIHLEFGPQMQIKGRGTEEHDAIVSFIKDRLEHWQSS